MLQATCVGCFQCKYHVADILKKVAGASATYSKHELQHLHPYHSVLFLIEPSNLKLVALCALNFALEITQSVINSTTWPHCSCTALSVNRKYSSCHQSGVIFFLLLFLHHGGVHMFIIGKFILSIQLSQILYCLILCTFNMMWHDVMSAGSSIQFVTNFIFKS